MAQGDQEDALARAWNEAALLHEEESYRVRRVRITIGILIGAIALSGLLAWYYL